MILTDTVVMVSPDTFGFNPQTEASNAFQVHINATEEEIRNRALKEFNEAVQTLRRNKLKVIVLPSPPKDIVPDAVFPNNWFSTHPDGSIVVYPMYAPNRRKEKQVATLKKALQNEGFLVNRIEDLSPYEDQNQFLEGTGSIVFDRNRNKAFAIESIRTHQEPFKEFCRIIGFTPILFHAVDNNNLHIYHTNVQMGIGDGYTVVCLEAIKEPQKRERVLKELTHSELEIIDITFEQVKAFCGNVLHLKSNIGERLIVVSQTALDAFTKEQVEKLQKYGKIVPLHIETIETIGGGSARCMLAEIFLPKK